MNKILFEETQNNKIVVIAAIIISILFGILSTIQIAFHKPLGNHPAPDWLLLLFFIGSIMAAFFFYFQKLSLLITENEIQISFGFLASKTTIKVIEIKSISIRKYDALKEFWGWGVRYNANERCFTVFGDNALEIELSNSEKILVGTQQPEKIKSVIDNLLSIQPR